ncbi:MAG: DUF4148 domain-containing protein [Ideonella sp.]|nr:DUF4148 domain-containing protein [Ideonella sp.]MBL0148650.1 DUF4148 domain-containing protein [Ideonella sp.]
MNAKQLFAASFIALAAAAAMADDITVDSTVFVSQKSRAEVLAELQQARAQGALLTSGDAVPVAIATRSELTREAVRSQVRTANARHELTPAGELYSVSAGVATRSAAH